MQSFSLNDPKNLVIYLIPIVSIVVGILLIPIFIYPAVTGVLALQATNREANARLQSLQQKKADLESSAKNEEYQQLFTELDKIYPSTKEVSSLIYGVYRLANDNRVVVESFKINPGDIAATPSATTATSSAEEAPTPTPQLAAVPEEKGNMLLELTTSGPLENQRTFIQTLSEVKRLMFIKSIKLEKGTDAESEYDITFHINVPYGGLPEKLTAGDAQLPTLSQEARDTINTLSKLPHYTQDLQVGE